MKKEIIKTCSKHGSVKFVLRCDKRYECRKCAVDRVTKRRRKVKEILVNEAGGKCIICGYYKYVGSLHFHHLYNKSFGISESGFTVAIDKLREEIKKCILVCSNCHGEIEAGLIDLNNFLGI